MGSLIAEVLRSVSDSGELRTLQPEASAFASRLEQDPTSRSALALARHAILESFAEYLRGRQTAGGR